MHNFYQKWPFSDHKYGEMWIRIIVLEPLGHFEEEIPPFKIIVLGLEDWDEIEKIIITKDSFFVAVSQISEYAADKRFKGIFKLLKWYQSLPPCLYPNHMAWHIADIGHHRHFFQAGAPFSKENPKFWPVLAILSQI